MSINEVLDAVRALSPEERAQVKSLLDTLPSDQADAQAKAARRLVDEGLLAGDMQQVLTDRRSPRRSPVEIKGKPLSETIIEERR